MSPGFDYRTGYYQRVCDLASGGMGTVTVEVRKDGAFERLYAVKRLHTHLRTDGEFRDMFMEEARIAGMIHHPNVVGVLDVGEDSEGPFLVMDYIDGIPLSSVLGLANDRRERLPIDLCVAIARDVARGLGAAHELRDRDGKSLHVVHRDVSPANVLVGYDGVSRLTDFGIARALGRTTRTATGMIKGKFAYLSPEQLRFEEPDQRSDLFSLGVVLHETLSGKRLYRGNDGARRILMEPPPDIGDERPEVPNELVALLFDLLAKDPDFRPKNAREVEHRLTSVLETFDAGERVDGAVWVGGLSGSVREARAEQLRIGMEALAHPAVKVTVAPARPRAWSRALLAAAAVALLVTGASVTFALLGIEQRTATQARGAEPEELSPPAIATEAASTPAAMAKAAPPSATETARPDDPVATAGDEAEPERAKRPRRMRRARAPASMMQAEDVAAQPSGLRLRGWDGQ